MGHAVRAVVRHLRGRFADSFPRLLDVSQAVLAADGRQSAVLPAPSMACCVAAVLRARPPAVEDGDSAPAGWRLCRVLRTCTWSAPSRAASWRLAT
jgi:hypothetical protein